jgi:hypothetical protein
MAVGTCAVGCWDGDDPWGARAVQEWAKLKGLVAEIDRLHAELPADR